MLLKPRKIGKPKYRWLPAYFGGYTSPPRPPYGDGRDTYRASYCDENDEWHLLFKKYFDEECGSNDWNTKHAELDIMLEYLTHLYEIERSPDLEALAKRILTDKYGWTIHKLERNELIKLVEKNLHVQGEMF